MTGRDRPQDEEGVQYDFPIHLSQTDRAHLRFVIAPRNRLVDFALVQQLLSAGTWREVVRFDCHGSVHIHRFTQSGAETRTEICDLDDIDRGYDVAVADIFDHWEENRRRYLHD